ncbi:MAG: PilX N-terminal domain-containing pilus assembly protein [Xanthomonadales bacterium]|nr:PilX N-terminal domain-containing pilus assembly protein [Xanthomonadales bacterium]
MTQPRTRYQHTMPARQEGVVLVVALIFLMLLTILAVSASSSSLLQEKMVGATRNVQLADWSAESALRGAEWSLYQTTTKVGGHVICTSGSISTQNNCVKYNVNSTLYDSGGTVAKFRHSPSWYTGTGKVYKGAQGGVDFTAPTTAYDTSALASNPLYIIEDMGKARPPGVGPQHESDPGGNPGSLEIHVFRITARATGGNKNVVRVMQSTFDAQTTN